MTRQSERFKNKDKINYSDDLNFNLEKLTDQTYEIKKKKKVNDDIKGKKRIYHYNCNYDGYNYEKNRKPGKIKAITNYQRFKELYVFNFRKEKFDFYQDSKFISKNCDLCPNNCGIRLNDWKEFKDHLETVEIAHNYRLVYLDRDSLPDIKQYLEIKKSNDKLNDKISFELNNSINNGNNLSLNQRTLFNFNNSSLNQGTSSNCNNSSLNQDTSNYDNLPLDQSTSNYDNISFNQNTSYCNNSSFNQNTSSNNISLNQGTSNYDNLPLDQSISSNCNNLLLNCKEIIDLTCDLNDLNDSNVNEEKLSSLNKKRKLETDELNCNLRSINVNLNYRSIENKEIEILGIVKNNLDNIFSNLNKIYLIDEECALNCKIPTEMCKDYKNYLYQNFGENYLIESISIDYVLKKLNLKELIESTNHNCLNLDLSKNEKLRNKFEIPESIQKSDNELNYSKSLLILKKNTFIDFHMNYLESDLEYFCVIKGILKFYLILPNDNNMNAFKNWSNNYNKEMISLISKYKLEFHGFLVKEGQTILLPKNYIYAIEAIFDTIVYGGYIRLNHKLNIEQQLKDKELSLSDLNYNSRFPFFNVKNFIKNDL